MLSSGTSATPRSILPPVGLGLALGAALLALAALLSPGWQGNQPFLRYRVLEQPPRLPVTAELPLEVAFELTRGAPRAVRFFAGPGPDGALRVQAFAGDRRIGAGSITEPGLARLELESVDPGVTRLVLQFQTQIAAPSRAPWVARAGTEPALEGYALQGGERSSAVPLLWFEYDSPARGLLWLWIPAALLLVVLARRGWGIGPALAGLALVATVTSVALWELFVSGSNAAGDPDGYGRAAQRLLAWLRLPREREAIEAWFGRYPHAQTALVSLGLLPGMALGVPMKLAYVGLNACLSAGALGLFGALARRIGLGRQSVLAAVVLLCAHLVFLRGFARPSPDALGLLLVIASLLWCVRRQASAAGDPWLPALYFLHLLARPQGPAICLFLFLAAVWIDARREERSLFAVLPRHLALAVGPVLAVLGLYLTFGWFHNLELSFRKAAGFRTHFTLPQLGSSLLAVLQLLPLMWFGARSAGTAGGVRAGKRPTLGPLLWAWMGFYLAMLLVVRAPLWPRHFLPLLPAAILLAARPGVGETGSVWRERAFWSLALVNLLAVLGTILFYLEGITAFQEQRLPELVYQMLYE